MGKFIYDSSLRVEFEDRLLAHLQAVVVAKVRRGESFTFTWKDDISTGGGRTAVYIQPRVSLVFMFQGGRMPPLNPAWLHALSYNANTVRGLYVVPEPDGAVRPRTPHEEMVFAEVAADAPMPAPQ